MLHPENEKALWLSNLIDHVKEQKDKLPRHPKDGTVDIGRLLNYYAVDIEAGKDFFPNAVIDLYAKHPLFKAPAHLAKFINSEEGMKLLGSMNFAPGYIDKVAKKFGTETAQFILDCQQFYIQLAAEINRSVLTPELVSEIASQLGTDALGDISDTELRAQLTSGLLLALTDSENAKYPDQRMALANLGNLAHLVKSRLSGREFVNTWAQEAIDDFVQAIEAAHPSGALVAPEVIQQLRDIGSHIAEQGQLTAARTLLQALRDTLQQQSELTDSTKKTLLVQTERLEQRLSAVFNEKNFHDNMAFSFDDIITTMAASHKTEKTSLQAITTPAKTNPMQAASFELALEAVDFLKNPEQTIPKGSSIPCSTLCDTLRSDIQQAIGQGNTAVAIDLLYQLDYAAKGFMTRTIEVDGQSVALLDTRFAEQLKSDPRTGLMKEISGYQDFVVMGLSYIESAKQLLQQGGSHPLSPEEQMLLNELGKAFFERMQDLPTHYPIVQGDFSDQTLRGQAEIAKLIDDALVPMLQQYLPLQTDQKSNKALRAQLTDVRDFGNFSSRTQTLATLSRTKVDAKYQGTYESQRSRVRDYYHRENDAAFFVDTLEIDTPITLPERFLQQYYGNTTHDLGDMDWFNLLDPHVQDAIRLHYDEIRHGGRTIPTQLRSFLPGFRNMYQKQAYVLDSDPCASMHLFSSAYHSGSSAHDIKDYNKHAVEKIKKDAKVELKFAKQELQQYQQQAQTAKKLGDESALELAQKSIDECTLRIKKLEAKAKDPVKQIRNQMTADAILAQAEALQIPQQDLFILSFLAPIKDKKFLRQLYQADKQGIGHTVVLPQNAMRFITLRHIGASKSIINFCVGLLDKVCDKRPTQEEFNNILKAYEANDTATADAMVNKLVDDPDKARLLREMFL